MQFWIPSTKYYELSSVEDFIRKLNIPEDILDKATQVMVNDNVIKWKDLKDKQGYYDYDWDEEWIIIICNIMFPDELWNLDYHDSNDNSGEYFTLKFFEKLTILEMISKVMDPSYFTDQTRLEIEAFKMSKQIGGN